ncbi:hypothetical protein CH333_04270 [candidate division WOR-3 bacterium JGI_Cruoil_03_44_89]|uniref:Soluble ligand binding domain-containing protein n=1 Tax=candidate division WOR-3 bacterium JGI_Cruoil_03_44_89 TaxID=1973748 RepID=A0A235BUW6_UNCW3|nr:MAG: hypothetical protein CH333_04270 [candidate division WOR-3 bacterium JGI_Cruoil_03_44_89]
MNFLLIFSVLCSTSIDDYILTVGDQLLISVYGSVSFSYQQTVTTNGEVFIQYVSSPPSEEAPFIAWEVLDVIKVVGTSVKDATEMAEERFKKYFDDVKVNLSVLSFRAAVYVSGAVGNPGTYPFLPGKRTREYVEDAGGLLPSADLSLIRVTKFDSIIEVTSESIVEENWSIYIPHSYVYVRGMVVEPGARSFNPNRSGLDYIGVSGGPSDRADMKGAYIITKDGKRLPITYRPPRYSTVVVPEIRVKWWQDYITIASAVTTILITWLTITK